MASEMIFITGLAASFLLALIVGRDAAKRNHAPILWFLLVWITGLVGALIYLVVRNPKYKRTPSPDPPSSQSTKNSANSQWQESSDSIFCERCGRDNDKETEYCDTCGNFL